MSTDQQKIKRNISRNFAQLLDDIKISRIKIGIDKKMQSDWRITLAMVRHPEMKKLIAEDIINTELN